MSGRSDKLLLVDSKKDYK